MKAIVAERTSASDLTAVFDDFFAQVNRSLDAHSSGPEAFNQLLWLISSHFDHGDGTASYHRLQTFGVANGTPFSDFFRSFRVVVSSVMGSEHELAPSVSAVLELVRRGVMNQFPGFMPELYLGALATVPIPFASVDAMWLSFQTRTTNKTPAINGEKYFYLPPSADSSLQTHAGNLSQSRSAAPSSHSGHVGFSRNPVVMRVAHADNDELDPFSSYNH